MERTGARAFAAYVDIAAGSAAETDYLLLLSKELGYVDVADVAKLCQEVNEIRRMLTALRQRLRSRVLRHP